MTETKKGPQPSKYAIKTPFDKIAMGLSGGGYRATAFHLGSMSYLHDTTYKGQPLLNNVKMLSTVSGGTFTGVYYAYQLVKEGKSFPEIFENLIGLLGQFDLLDAAMAKLHMGEDEWPAHKRRNIINAFALTYDELYVNSGTFGDLAAINGPPSEADKEADSKISKPHLEDIAFNATELTHGSLFRFKNGRVMGNKPFSVPKEAKSAVKLGDIIASSSCFPGGFEPLAFPDDFFPTNSKARKAFKNKAQFNEPIGIMDGGICDNQGVDSILKAESSNRKKTDEAYYYDLIIISDVSAPAMGPFEFSKKEDAPSSSFFDNTFTTLKNQAARLYRWIYIGIYTLGGLSLLGLIFSMGQNNWMLGAGIFGLLLTILLLFGIQKIKTTAIAPMKLMWADINSKKELAFVLDKIRGLKLEKITFQQFREPVLDRLGSVFTLLNEVFLTQIRRMIYGDVYQSTKWEYRQISNLIYELGPFDFQVGTKLGKSRRYGPWLSDEDFEQDQTSLKTKDKTDNWTPAIVMEKMLGTKIPEVAAEARKFGTQLWFEKLDKSDEQLHILDKLIATGQFTMCFNLIVYINQLKHQDRDGGVKSGYAGLETAEKTAIDNLLGKLMSDWKKFSVDPYFKVPGQETHTLT